MWSVVIVVLSALWAGAVNIVQATQVSCSADKVALPGLPAIASENTWKEYLKAVYGSDAAHLSKEEASLLYKTIPVAVKAIDWGHKRPLSDLSDRWGDTFFRYSHRAYQDNEWAEVNRYSTYFLNSYTDRGDVWEEGLSRGFPGRSKYNSTKVAYGCWFNTAPGSGIFVNVGRTLVVTDKYKSTLFKDLGLTSKGCLRTDATGRSCYDRYVCTAALAKGYDSVQVTGRSEIVLCSGRCATEALRYACPPVELRSGVNASRPCACSDESHLLNCGKHPNSVPDLRWNFPSTKDLPGPQQRPLLCVARYPPPAPAASFNLTLVFTDSARHKRTSSFSPTEKRVAAIKAVHDSHQGTPILLVGTVTAISATTPAQPSSPRRELPGSGRRRGSSSGSSKVKPPLTLQDGLRTLQVTPFGPYNHSTLSVPPPPLAQTGETTDARYSQQEQYHGHHHHHHQHKDHHAKDSNKDERDKQVDQLPAHSGNGSIEGQRVAARFAQAASARAAGYHAVLVVPTGDSDPVLRSLLLPQNSDPDNGAAVMITAGITVVENIKVGLIAYANVQPGGNGLTIRTYIDEAACLREGGAQVVVLLAASAQIVSDEVLQGLRGYVDLVLVAGAPRAVSCGGKWHSSSGQSPVLLYIPSDTLALGVVHIEWSAEDKAFSFRSEVTLLQR